MTWGRPTAVIPQPPVSSGSGSALTGPNPWIDPTTPSVTVNVGGVPTVYVMGARFDGVTDDTAAITNAQAAANADTKYKVKLPAGNPVFNGPGLTGADYNIEGTGWGATIITLGPATYFIDSPAACSRLRVEQIGFEGGLGGIHFSFTGANSGSQQFNVDSNRFHNYTSCALGHNATDWPFWRITRNIFHAASDAGTIGVALAGSSAGCTIRDNAFNTNFIMLKLNNVTGGTRVVDNDFVEFLSATDGRVYGLWIVPMTIAANAGYGFTYRGNKLGNENGRAADYRFLFADGLGGPDFTTDSYNVGADSVNFVAGLLFDDNGIETIGATTTACVYSTTQNVRGCAFKNFNFSSSLNYPYFLQIRTVPMAVERLATFNIFGPFVGGANFTELTACPISNAVGLGVIVDPISMLQDSQGATLAGGSDLGQYVKLATGRTSAAWTLNAGMTVAAIADAEGRNDAAEFTTTGTGSAATLVLNNGSIIVGAPIFVEFDLWQGSVNPITNLQVTVEQTSGTVFHMKRVLAVGAITGWQRYRIGPIFIRSTGVASRINLKANGTGIAPVVVGNFRIGRWGVYHGREPVAYEAQFFMSLADKVSALTDAANVATDASLARYFTLSAAAGRTISAPTNPLTGMQRTWDLLNNSGGAMVTTWNAIFKLAGAWVDPANTKRRKLIATYDGTNWVEDARSAADI